MSKPTYVYSGQDYNVISGRHKPRQPRPRRLSLDSHAAQARAAAAQLQPKLRPWERRRRGSVDARTPRSIIDCRTPPRDKTLRSSQQAPVQAAPAVVPVRQMSVAAREKARVKARVEWQKVTKHESAVKARVQEREDAVHRSSTLTKAQYQSLKQLFREYDSDMNGYIDVKEFEGQIRKKHPELVNHVSGMFKSADANSDRKISFAEFMQAQQKGLRSDVAHRTIDKFGGAWQEEEDAEAARVAKEEAEQRAIEERQLTEEELDELFQVFDSWDESGNGRLTFKALSRHPVIMRSRIGCYTLGSWIHQHDVDKDCRLNREEFASMLRKYYGSSQEVLRSSSDRLKVAMQESPPVSPSA